jgi:DNA-binding response OmpR family regulator
MKNESTKMSDKQHLRLSILVVEDNDDIRRILQDLLSANGHKVDSAEDGEKGLAFLQAHDYDIMITDLGLPGISGWDLSLASKRYQKEMPVVAISSWQGKEAEKRISNYGINQVIWKPFRFGQIQKALKKYCSMPSDINP